jgi:hypothetical protein
VPQIRHCAKQLGLRNKLGHVISTETRPQLCAKQHFLSPLYIYLFLFIYLLFHAVCIRKTEMHYKQLPKHYYKIMRNIYLSLNIFNIKVY